jgi:hypothetical protein
MRPDELDDQHVGKLLVYIAIPTESIDRKPFIVVSKIVKFAWDGGKLFVDVDDYVCTRDQHLVSSIEGGKWRRPAKRKIGTKPIWLDTSVSMLACIFDALCPQNIVPTVTRRQIVEILTASSHPLAVSFMGRVDTEFLERQMQIQNLWKAIHFWGLCDPRFYRTDFPPPQPPTLPRRQAFTTPVFGGGWGGRERHTPPLPPR